jgi:hypothetical protein
VAHVDPKYGKLELVTVEERMAASINH